MDLQEVKQQLQGALGNCEIEINGDGQHFDILAIGTYFEGLSRVKRQQAVYAVLNPWIASGQMHAVNMRIFTPAEWAQQQSQQA